MKTALRRRENVENGRNRNDWISHASKVGQADGGETRNVWTTLWVGRCLHDTHRTQWKLSHDESTSDAGRTHISNWNWLPSARKLNFLYLSSDESQLDRVIIWTIQFSASYLIVIYRILRYSSLFFNAEKLNAPNGTFRSFLSIFLVALFLYFSSRRSTTLDIESKSARIISWHARRHVHIRIVVV